jgi:hypothetical protein
MADGGRHFLRLPDNGLGAGEIAKVPEGDGQLEQRERARAVGRQERGRTLEQVRGRRSVATRERPRPSEGERGTRAVGEAFCPLVHPGELASVPNRLLEVITQNLVVLDAARRRSPLQ